jgi:hypothetical protein
MQVLRSRWVKVEGLHKVDSFFFLAINKLWSPFTGSNLLTSCLPPYAFLSFSSFFHLLGIRVAGAVLAQAHSHGT